MEKVKNLQSKLLPLLLIFSQSLMAQNIGVKTSTPLTTLDINGSIAMREGTPLSKRLQKTTKQQA